MSSQRVFVSSGIIALSDAFAPDPLLQVTDSETKRWWEDFMTEFFHDSSTLVIETDLGEGTRKYRESTIINMRSSASFLGTNEK